MHVHVDKVTFFFLKEVDFLERGKQGVLLCACVCKVLTVDEKEM